MAINVEEIVRECEGPKFLAHRLCSRHSEDRPDIHIYDTLSKGDRIRYEGTYVGEFAFSVWPWQMNEGGRQNWGAEKAKGLVIFSPKFYDKICSWDAPAEELFSLYDDLESFRIMEATRWLYGGSSTVIEKKELIARLTQQVNPERLRSVGGVLNGDFSDEKEAESYYLSKAHWAITSILGLRYGPFKSQYRNAEIRRKIEEHLAPEYCINGIRIGDTGARAVRFTPERDLVALDVSREDVKYLISWSGDKKSPKILIGPK